MRLLIFILLASFSLLAKSATQSTQDTPPQVGNFALPYSQQPGPLISFGENILGQNQKQLFLLMDDYAGVNKHFVDVVPGFLYGITDNLSLFLNTPYAASYKANQNYSTGFEDVIAQLEYVLYGNSTHQYTEQATLVTNITAPTGSINKNPPTGTGSTNFFLGATYNRTYENWFIFTSPGGNFTTAKNGTKVGNSYLYQFGFGRNITDYNGWILAWLTEFNGTYEQHDRIQGLIDPNSGGNIIYVTPSLWLSSKRFIFQFGVGIPITQHLYGNQKNNTFLTAANIGVAL